MTLSEIRSILNARGIQLTKSLGQNFLHDQNQLQKIASAANLTAADKVLEVGPGLGPLTDLLVAQAGTVLAIEMDQRLVEFLREKFISQTSLELIHADALAFVRSQRRDWSEWKLVANLPYSVASPLLVELAEADGPPQKIVVTLQSEVAHRIAAQSGEDDYGLLSLLLQLVYEPVSSFKIPPTCFFPAPDVDSTCIVLERRPIPLLPAQLAPKFKRVVKLALSQRRKMMLKLLKQDWPKEKLEAAFSELNLSPQIRAEQVSLEKFVALTRLLATDRA